MKTVSIHQPDFLPWLGFYHRLVNCDVFVVLDDAQFLRRGWTHRNKIKTSQGEKWLTVPVKKKGRFRQAINAVEILSDGKWPQRHLRTLESSYAKSPFFKRYFPTLKSILEKEHPRLIDLNMEVHGFLMNSLALPAKTILASGLDIAGKREQRLVDIVKAVGGTAYLSGTGARDYIDEAVFKDAGLKLIWQEFPHPVYPQRFMEQGFIPCLSLIDCLFNCGEETPQILRTPQMA